MLQSDTSLPNWLTDPRRDLRSIVCICLSNDIFAGKGVQAGSIIRSGDSPAGASWLPNSEDRAASMSGDFFQLGMPNWTERVHKAVLIGTRV